MKNGPGFVKSYAVASPASPYGLRRGMGGLNYGEDRDEDTGLGGPDFVPINDIGTTLGRQVNN